MATGSVGANSSDTLKCADSEYPLIGAGIWVICLTQPEL